MFFEIGGLVVVAGIVASISMIKGTSEKDGKSKKNIEIIVSDYLKIKSAYKKFKSVENRFLDSLEDLMPYIEDKEDIKFSKYKISKDGKYLIVKKCNRNDGNIIIERIGGTSKYVGEGIYLSFLSLKKYSKIQPEAKLKIFPENEIYTTTNLEYNLNESIVEDNEIKDKELNGNEPRFSKPGEYVITAKIMDKNDNWSKLTTKTIIVKEDLAIKSISVGADQISLLRKNGNVYIKGNNSSGQFGDSTIAPKEELKLNENIENISKMVFGDDFGVYLSYDGTVHCSGKNNFGQLGTGDRHNSKYIKKVWGLEKIIDIDAGSNFAAALSRDGKLYLWGNNEDGQLCKKGTAYSELPEAVQNIERVKQVSLGSNHGLALLYNGHVIAWGENKSGQLACGYKDKGSSEPVFTEFKNVKSVFAGNNFSMIIGENGRVYSVGTNKRNQLGYIGENNNFLPKEVMGLKNIIKLSNKGKFVLALSSSGNVYTWGEYKPSDNEYDVTPKKIEELPFIHDIGASLRNGYAMDIEGKIYKWNNDYKDKKIIEIVEEDNIENK